MSDWGLGGRFFSVVRAPDELSVVSEQSSYPEGIDREDGRRCYKVESPFDFDLPGVVSPVAARLAEGGTKVLVVATQDSDYLMVKQPDLQPTIKMLEEAGLRVDR